MLGTTSFPMMTVPLATAVQIVFLLMVAAYALFTAILYYHWNSYADNRMVTRLTFVLYFLATLPCVGVMGIMAYTI
jgi:hypothetical protein